jgi:5-methylcytosine-specific restriction endonuclease McrA
MNKYQKRVIVKRCVVCKSGFLGSIDPSGLFCSISCRLKFKGPLPEIPPPPPPPVFIEKPKSQHQVSRHKNNSGVRRLSTEEMLQRGKKWKKKHAKQLIKRLEEERKALLKNKKTTFVNGFYTSDNWRRLRYEAIIKYGRKCMACGAVGPGVVFHVDHIKPRSQFPHLELNIDNLQVLCESCNIGKSNWDQTDWRKTP